MFEIRNAKRIIKKANRLEKTIEKLSDAELQNKTSEFRNKIYKGVNPEQFMPEILAVVREASKRMLGMRHYDEQLIGSIILNNGDIAEMKTGEGKTLVATASAYVNALYGEGVHVVTVNDYLAERDAELMGKLYNFLGLTVGCVTSGMDNESRKHAYDCDITYGINSEFGFDYLRDNMVKRASDRVQRGLSCAIIDEVDSILIDEARTPLIISGGNDAGTKDYTKADSFVKSLGKKDYDIEKKDKLIALSDRGLTKAENFYGVNLSETENAETMHFIMQALRANYIMKKNVDYINQNGEILIVDEFTGRVMEGRRFSDGLHQAIEAKEGVKIQAESKTYATITVQNFFRMYKKLSGMTGTASSDKDEFREVYNMNVVSIPTHKPVARIDLIDDVFETEDEKWEAICEDIKKVHATGRPILIGTASVKHSEALSVMLESMGIAHNVLNAKNHKEEAKIIAQAGRLNAVTVSTNMAGRGTDILLGGNPSFMEDVNAITKSLCETEKEQVLELGGLYVIGTERYESKRVDDQLRGRAGRQGDKGTTKFFCSMEDDLIKRFNEKIPNNASVSFVDKTQKRVEGNNFGARKNVLKYDDVLNLQRKIIYNERNRVLECEDMSAVITNMIADSVDDMTDDTKRMIMEKAGVDADGITDSVINAYKEKEDELGEAVLRNTERAILLNVIDNAWVDHLDAMEQLKTGIGLRAIGQLDPAVEFAKEGKKLFDSLMNRIERDTVTYCFQI